MSDEQGSGYSGMDTEQFIALNAQYLGDDGSRRAESGSESDATRPISSTADGPVNPLVAAREANAAGEATGTYGSAPTSQELYPIDEQTSGKSIDTSFGQKRHPGRVILIILLVIVIIALVCGGIFLFLRHRAGNEATQNVKTAWSNVVAYDTTIDDLTNAINNELNNGTIDQGVSDAMLKSEGISKALTSASDTVATNRNTSKYLLTSEQNAAIDDMNNAIAARRSIIAIGRDLLLNDTTLASSGVSDTIGAIYNSIADATNQVAASGQQFDAYNAAVAAGEDATDAANAVNANDAAAIADIQSAQQALATAQQGYPAADFSAIETYLTDALNDYTALQALHAAAFTGGDVATAQAQLDACNATLAQSAANLPTDASAALSGAYKAIVSQYSDTFTDACDQRQTSDDNVTKYLENQGESVEEPTAGDGAALAASSAADASAATEATEPVAPEAAPADAAEPAA